MIKANPTPTNHRWAMALVLAVLAILSGCGDNESAAAKGSNTPAANTAEAPVAQKDAEQAHAEDELFKDVQLDYPAADPVLGMIDSREQMSLNGQWALTVDPMGVGEPGSIMGGFNENHRPQTPMDLIEYDLAGGMPIRVPGDINSQSERLFFYRGRVWYYRNFEFQPAEGERQHLWFGGANFLTRVFLNGQAVGRHDGGYVPFSFDVTNQLKSGTNDLVIAIEDNLDADSVPTKRTDWWPYSGLTRDVALVSTPTAFIRNARIQLAANDPTRIAVRVATEGFSAGDQVRVDIPELGVEQTLAIAADGSASASIEAAPALWSPDSPVLYDVRLSAGEDRLSDRIGFRTIETRGTQILLNGKPIKLKGISAHEEPIGEAGVIYSAEQAERLLREAKALNANFVRAAHYPHARHLARIADEMGLMLWEEVPVYWNIAWTNPETLDVARNMQRRLIERDWNRASVVIWSVANETPYSEPRMAFLGQLIDDARAIDGDRLVSAALLGGMDKFEEITLHLAIRGLARDDLTDRQRAIFQAVVDRAGNALPDVNAGMTLEINDPLGEKADIIAYNEYFGWYYAGFLDRQLQVGTDVLRELMFEFMSGMTITAKYDKPVHISEFGAGAKAGRKGGAPELWTEEYQAKVYKAQIDMLTASPQVQGMTPWVLKDFRAMLRTHPEIQQFYNRKGLVDPDGQRKLAFDVLADFYAGEWN